MKKSIVAPIYPCSFPIKVIGEDHHRLETVVIQVMSSLGECIDQDGMAIKHSKSGKYISVTFRIIAESIEHLDRIYSALTAQEDVIMVL